MKHDGFVDPGYFDRVQEVISGGLASTTALNGSTEFEPVWRKAGRAAAHLPGSNIDLGSDEVLLGSGE